MAEGNPFLCSCSRMSGLQAAHTLLAQSGTHCRALCVFEPMLSTGSVTAFGGKGKEGQVNAIVPFLDRRGRALASCKSCFLKQEDSLSGKRLFLVFTVMKLVSHISETEL